MSINIDKIKVDGYDGGAAPSPAPDAAKFGRGAANLEQIKEATAARTAHSVKLTQEAAKAGLHDRVPPPDQSKKPQ